jgi:hypothetical protein
MRAVPREDGVRERCEELRRRNDRIAFNARTQRFGPEVLVPFMCECSDERCGELVRMTLERFEAGRSAADFLAAPGHQVEEARIVRVRDGVWLYRVA